MQRLGEEHEEEERSGAGARLGAALSRRYQRVLDQATPHPAARWLVTLVLFALYVARVYIVGGFYVVSYALGIYILNLFIGFLSPQLDPDRMGPSLPVHNDDEFRPFERRLPELQFWHKCSQAFLLCLFLTLFRALDVPVFWPILLMYFVMLLFLTLKRQIKHMIKHRYVPFTVGKRRYGKADVVPE